MYSPRYILQPYKGMNTRHMCPACQSTQKTFVRYIDVSTGRQIHDSVGRCNRENNCGYHYSPKQYFAEHKIDRPSISQNFKTVNIPSPKQVSFINEQLYRKTLEGYQQNHFATYIAALFGAELASQLTEQYNIGTSSHWHGATIFWQIDALGRIRTGKIMLYDPETGKRVKEPYNHIYWVHNKLKREFYLSQCLFGAHLLNGNTKPVAIVESEKTAIIASVYIPEFLWLATGSLSNLTEEKCRELANRPTILFPDLGAFDKWKQKAATINSLKNCQISDLLELKATQQDKAQGLDLADYLIRFPFTDFHNHSPKNDRSQPIHIPTDDSVTTPKETVNNKIPSPHPANTYSSSPSKSMIEDACIQELEDFFNFATLPPPPILLTPACKIQNPAAFVSTHLATIKACKRTSSFTPYVDRLKALRLIIEAIK